jgi:hypothetical protein
MAVTFGVIGTAGAGTTSCSPAYPTSGISASTSVLYCLVTGVSSVAGTAFTGPSGWTSVGQLEGGVGSFAADTGQRRVAWFKKDTVTGSESGTVTFSLAAGGATSTISAQIVRFDKAAGTTVTEQFASGADAVNNTSYQAVTTGSLNWNTGDLLAIGVAQNIDTGTATTRNISATGVTFGTLSSRVAAAVNNGNDHRRILDTVPVTSASATSAATYTYTISASGSGPAAFLLLTETGTPVTTGLTGAEITSGSGVVEPPPTRGQVATFAQELLSVIGVTVALVGAVVTSDAGNVNPNSDGTVALSGAAVTLNQGTVSPEWPQSLSGSEITSAPGSVAPLSSPPTLTGQVGALSTGTVSASGNSVTVHISGIDFEVALGQVTSGETLITGSESVVGAGTAVPSWEVALTGSELTSTTGQIAPDQGAVDVYISASAGVASANADVALVGGSITVEQGDIEPSADADIPITGIEITSAAGTIDIDKSFPITGQAFTAEQNNIGAPGYAALAGAEITSSAGSVFLDGDRSVAITGESVSVLDGLAVTSYLAFVEGLELTASSQEIGPKSVDLSGVEIISETGYVDIPRRNQDAGRPKKRKKHQVEIEGQVYEADSEAEALYMLEKVKEQAEAAAKLALERANKALKKPIRKILQDARKALQPPVVDSDELPSEAEQILKEIDDLYKDTLMKVEIAALLRKQEEEEEEAILLMLV